MRIAIAIAILLAAGCSHPTYTLAAPEQCAVNDMVLEGMNLSRGNAWAASSNGTTSSSYGAGQSLQCVRPQTADDRCEIDAMTASAVLKRRANDGELESLSDADLVAARQRTYGACKAGSSGASTQVFCFKYRSWGDSVHDRCFTSVAACSTEAAGTRDRIRVSGCFAK